MAFYKSERLALFIDGANLYSAGKTLGVEVDYRKLLEEFRRRGQLIRAYYYTALIENDDYSPIRPLVDWLQYNGFKVVTKPAKEFTDSTGRRRVKGDMDVEITVDMLNLSAHVDHVVLFSGDGDLTRLVEAVCSGKVAEAAECFESHILTGKQRMLDTVTRTLSQS